MKSDLYYMEIAYREALKAYKKDEIPIGVVIVVDDKIIAKGHNLRDNTNIVTKHGEIIAIEKANKIMNNWRLPEATLYTTLEPCNMCSEVINESKIKKVIYAAKRSKSKSRYKQISNKEIIKKCSNLIKNKFKEIREK